MSLLFTATPILAPNHWHRVNGIEPTLGRLLSCLCWGQMYMFMMLATGPKAETFEVYVRSELEAFQYWLCWVFNTTST